MKSKRTKALEISQELKKQIIEEQKGLSPGGVWLGRGAEFHHLIPRSAGGLGNIYNIIAITPMEHRQYHDKVNIKVGNCNRYTWQEFETLMFNSKKILHPEWTRDKCIYKKGN